MAWFKKKPDPISDRERALSAEIAALESEIKSLDQHLQRRGASPRLRSTALPHGPTVARPASPPAHEPIFEEVYAEGSAAQAEAPVTPTHFNELGVRKYDLPALFARFGRLFRGPSTTNPKLVSYLAAGGIQGLRPLRYEKRVMRNRLIVLVIAFVLVLLGLLVVFVRNR